MKKSKSIIGELQSFMNSPKGKTILNYLYSWGAAIVILGALFKLTHIQGANLMLFLGMGTEVIVFFFSAFERPYDIEEEEANDVKAYSGAGSGQPIIINGPIMTGCTGTPVATTEEANSATVVAAAATPAATPAATEQGSIVIGGGTAATTGGAVQPIPAVSPANIEEMDKATEEYVEKVKTLTEAIQRISQQTEALGRNMEEMDTLSRNLTGVNALYEVHLRSAGGQLNAIDQVNEQTKKMAQQIEELNSLYARMIEAMTSRMDRPQI